MQRHRQPVQLVLTDVADLRSLARQLAHASIPVAQFLFAVYVVERQHRPRVRHLREAFFRLAAHALRRRIGRHQLRMLGLQRLQLPHQRIEIGIGNLRRIQPIVQMLMVANRLAQLLDLLFSCLWTHGSDSS